MLTIEAEREIEALLIRYATAADDRDFDLLGSCFTEDVKADYGAIGAFESRAAFVGHLEAMLGGCGTTLHFITNPVIKGDAGAATARSYTHAVVHIPGLEAPVRTAGSYDDRLVHGPDGWRIAERVYTAVA